MADTLIADLVTITGAQIDPADLVTVVDVSDTTLDAQGSTKQATVAAAHTTLYDKSSGAASLIADNDALTIQDDIDFVSHGKLDLTGLDPTLGAGSGTTGPIPTWYDPVNSTNWFDNGWFAFEYDTDLIEMFVGQGNANTFEGTAFWKETAKESGGLYFAQGYAFAIDDAAAAIAEIGTRATAQADGSEYEVSIFGNLDASTAKFSMTANSTTGALARFAGGAGQTSELLDVDASDGYNIFRVTGDKKIGFFNAAPVTQRTGVAVSTAGIHAALVSLGLITA
jgi:hypothetical protein